MLIREIIQQFAEEVIAGFQKNIREKPVTQYGAMNNTGAAADSFFWRYDGQTLEIGSTWKYIRVLETGRGPTSATATKGNPTLRENILEWVETKVRPTDISAKSLAYLIARKIHKEGTLLYRQGGNSGILSEFTNEEWIRKTLTPRLRDAIIFELRTNLFRKAS
jgi:hypothetical protein